MQTRNIKLHQTVLIGPGETARSVDRDVYKGRGNVVNVTV